MGTQQAPSIAQKSLGKEKLIQRYHPTGVADHLDTAGNFLILKLMNQTWEV